jgi:hypothetical protein
MHFIFNDSCLNNLGEGRSIVIKAESAANGLRQIAEAIKETGGQQVNLS